MYYVAKKVILYLKRIKLWTDFVLAIAKATAESRFYRKHKGDLSLMKNE